MASTENQDSAAALARQDQQQQHQPAQPQETAAQQPTQQQAVPQAPPQLAPVAPEVAHQQQAVPAAAPVPSPQQQAALQRPLQTPASAQQAAVAAAAAAVNVPVGLPQNVGTAAAAESLVCQWQGCSERLHTPEALYEHVCERHVGRKSTNNLNLTCGWGNCRTTTVKRDHITSHIRVHVPLKPHKCEFCGKAFKRPQDLKKHVKTHADDSVLMRSPEPNAANRPPNNMFHVPVQGDGKPAHYFESTLPGAPYAHPGTHYYPPGPPHPQHPPNPSYGNVYYAVGGDGSQAAYESKKRGYDAINEFFGDMKRRQFDPFTYSAVGQRLQSLHGLSLPLVHAGPVPEYQQAPAMATVGGHGAYGPAPAPAQSYHLPPMGHLRTKTDLAAIDTYLEQMQTTIFEPESEVAAAGVAQPGAHYVHGAMSYRPSHSPPAANHGAHYAATAATSSTPTAAPSTAARSPLSATPALTPPSSAQSYTSGRSPISLPSTHHSNGGGYPTLPSTTTQEHPAPGYPAVSSAAPASTLSSAFDSDDRRRFGGGMLQRSRDYPTFETAYAGEVSGYATANTPTQKPSPNVIDPALSRESDNLYARSQASSENNNITNKIDLSTPSTPEAEDKSEPRDQAWVENVRILTGIRDFVRAVAPELPEGPMTGVDEVTEVIWGQILAKQTRENEQPEQPERSQQVEHTEEVEQSGQVQQSEDNMDVDAPLYPDLGGHVNADDAHNHGEQTEMDES